MSIETMEIIRRVVAEEAVEHGFLRIPQLQIPSVEFNVPEGVDADLLKDRIEKKLVFNSSICVYVAKNRKRIRVVYRT